MVVFVYNLVVHVDAAGAVVCGGDVEIMLVLVSHNQTWGDALPACNNHI